MPKLILRTALSGTLFLVLTLPAPAQRFIPAGKDIWVTPNNGQTFFTFPDGDVESLCGATPSSNWDHKVPLVGEPIDPGQDWDTMVLRLDDAVFNAQGIATTRVQLGNIAMRSDYGGSVPPISPCGRLNWTVSPFGTQPVTLMTIRRTSSGGGVFFTDLAVSVELKAYEIHHGDYVGSLFYSFVLPEPGTGTPWSIGPSGQFRPGITPANNCINVLRQKLSQTAVTSSHYYFISNMIAQGNCNVHP